MCFDPQEAIHLFSTTAGTLVGWWCKRARVSVAGG
jgi:hypothetical protein